MFRSTALIAAMFAACAFTLPAGLAQDVQVVPGGGGRRVVTAPGGPGAAAPQPSSSPGGEKPADAAAKEGEDDGKKPKDGKGDEKSKDEDKVIKRSHEPPMPPDPSELNVRPDADGTIAFNFRFQPWPDVLDWLAKVSEMSLDWQELPKDYLNLTTQRRYTVPEARDLINRHLLARGFTLLVNGEIMSVANIATLNPALVPRVNPADLTTLARQQPHAFVKVSFPLQWLLAEKAVKELEPMVSPNGKLSALTNTNRIEAMDAAINLLEIDALLRQEQSDSAESPLVEEFSLQHARAEDVIGELEALLGIESKQAAPPMNPQQMQQMMQQMQQMQQQGQANAGAGKQVDVKLVVNPRKNSIIAYAPPDKMAVIAQAVKALDVRSGSRDSLLARPDQVDVYRLHNLDPETLAKTLWDLGELQPTTRLEIDERNNALIVYGSLVDHATIRQLIQRLDGSGREFEVVRLRRLPADYVAGTVEFMMIGEKKEEQRPRYGYFSFGYGRGDERPQDDDEFRVDADLENNLLLLWANEVEIEAVMQLLVKLGEIPPEGGDTRKLRVLQAVPPEDAARFLEQLRRAWPSLRGNPLNLPEPPRDDADEDDSASPETPVGPPVAPKEARRAPHPSAGQLAAGHPVARWTRTVLGEDADQNDVPSAVGTGDALPTSGVLEEEGREADLGDPDGGGETTRAAAPAAPAAAAAGPSEADRGEPAEPDEPDSDAGAAARDEADESSALLRRLLERQRTEARRSSNAEPPPVNLSFAPDGSLVITSDDTHALDLLEELISQIAPPAPDYKVFRLKFADAYWVKDNLEEFFKDEDEENNSNSSRRYYFYDYAPQEKKEPRYRLSQRRKLKFIYDLDTNSILVQGADAQQLATIEDLIAIYDQAEPSDSQSARLSSVFEIKYSKATVIAAAVKDVYRDLLSSNDKALQGNPEQRNRETPGGMTYIFNDGEGEGGQDRTQVRFKGKLSIGIDEVSNTLLVSAEGEHLMRNVAEMIQSLDEAARPLSAVAIVHLNGTTNAERVREVLAGLLSDAPATTPAPQQPGDGEQPGGPRGNGPNGGQRGGGFAPASR